MTEDQRNSPKLLIGIIGALIAVIAAFVIFQWINADEAELTPPAPAAETPAPAPAEAVQQTLNAQKESSQPAQLIHEDVLKAPVPENASLAKEEAAKLDDIQAQLHDQEKTLKAQHADADQLIKLKEEQIKLLEQQLAQKP